MSLTLATPRCTVWLFKTISRKTTDGISSVSTRYNGKDPFIDLTPFLGDGSSVRTTKSVREPAGGFNISFLDQVHTDFENGGLESIYGLIEPMDVIEIRMWGGVGKLHYPIVMRGFVSEIGRSQAMGGDGKVQRVVTVSGQDYGKIWQTFRILYMPAYAEGKLLLTSYSLRELFGVKEVNAMPAGDFVRVMVEQVLNPHIAGFLPETLPSDIPKKIQTGESISVKHGMVNQSVQNQQDSVYSILHQHGDVGTWNELYTEDREDGVHCVYRATPAMHLTQPKGSTRRLIQDDALEPIYVNISDGCIQSLTVSRSDANVANFFWVNNSKFDLVDDITRKLFALQNTSGTVSLSEYPNTATKYYGTRPMYAETQQGEDAVDNQTSGLPEPAHSIRSAHQERWIDQRRRTMMEMNRDNVVFERGTAKVKGGPERTSGDLLKAGDYVKFKTGNMQWSAYVYQVDHEFVAYQGYTTTLHFERGAGFTLRTTMGGQSESPWLVEQARRTKE